MLLNWIGDWRTNKPFVRHAVKTTFAACLSYAIVAYFDLPQSFWAAVVAIFVTQANVGASLGQAFYWFLGSLLGGVDGGLADTKAITVAAGTVSTPARSV
ncbi:MAG: FUSC family protein [Hyphomicrobium sp.]